MPVIQHAITAGNALVIRSNGSDVASSLLAASIGKCNGHLHLAPVSKGSPLIAVRECDVALTVAGSIVDVYVARLMLFRPYEGKRNRLSLGWKYEWLFGVASLNSPAGRR
jgi:hypothetical protein